MTLALEAHRRARPLLGTLVELRVVCGSEPEFIRLSDLAFDRIAHYHALMSFHDAASDVRRIASAAPGETLQLAPETCQVIAAAQAFEAESAGIFNIAIARELVARGHLPALPQGAGQTNDGRSACRCLRLDDQARITVLQPVWIDLGGIAKGAAVDAGLSALRAAGALAASVNAGGDMAFYGDDAQPVTVRGPRGRHLQIGMLADGAIATSGPFADASASSLVLNTARPARWADRAVSVVAPTCLVADALTKVLAALGPEAAPLLAAYDALGFSIDADGLVERVP